MLKIADPILMREINKFSILETIRRHEKISRVEITKLTQLSRTTVSAITGALIETGLIEANHIEEASRGRPRVKLALVADAAYAIGATLTANELTLTLADFRGKIVLTATHTADFVKFSLDALSDFISANLLEACAAAKIDHRRVNGLCIGIPGLTDSLLGTCAPESRFSSISPFLSQALNDRTGIPVFLENHANLLALERQWFGHIETACAVIAWHDTLEMSFQYASESPFQPALGHTKIRGRNDICECGQIDCAHAYLTRAALAKNAHTSDTDFLDDNILSSFARSSDPSVQNEARFIADILGQSLAHVVNLFHPEVLILTSESPAYLDVFSDDISRSIHANSVAEHLNNTQIEFLASDPHRIASGATALVLKEFYKAPWMAQEAI